MWAQLAESLMADEIEITIKIRNAPATRDKRPKCEKETTSIFCTRERHVFCECASGKEHYSSNTTTADTRYTAAEMAVDRRNGTKAAKLSNNPLFRAMSTSRGGPTAHAASQHHTSRRKHVIKSTPRTTKVNELQRRMGLTSSSIPSGPSAPKEGDKGRVPVSNAIARNPLAAALGLVKPVPNNNNRRVVRGRDVRKPNRSNTSIPSGESSGKLRYRERERESTAQHKTNVPSSNRVGAGVGVGSNSSKSTGPRANASTNASANASASKINLNFKNASLIPFLRIENLEPTVNETDIRMVLSRSMGPTLKILKMNTIFQGEPSVTAEVFFLDEDRLGQYVDTLNGLDADGHHLKATIAYHSNIINSDKLWEAVLKEVRYIKQEVTRRNLEQRMLAQVPGAGPN